MPVAFGYDDARQAITAAFKAGWLAAGDPARIEYPNQPLQHTDASPWARLSLLWGKGDGFQNAAQVSLGSSPCLRWTGQIVLQIFVTEEKGTTDGLTLADTFLGIWQSGSRPLQIPEVGDSGSIRTEFGWVTDDGKTDGFHQFRAIVPFKRDVQAS